MFQITNKNIFELLRNNAYRYFLFKYRLPYKFKTPKCIKKSNLCCFLNILIIF